MCRERTGPDAVVEEAKQPRCPLEWASQALEQQRIFLAFLQLEAVRDVRTQLCCEPTRPTGGVSSTRRNARYRAVR
jgi:hypothetical protein